MNTTNLIHSIFHRLAALTNNCVHFRHEWQRDDAANNTTELAGRWHGEWVSKLMEIVAS
jgi:hypothetical protein